MDPVSVALGCIALLPPIAKASKMIGTFVLEVHDARKEMNMLQSELISLSTVLEILAQDMKECPENVFPTILVENIKSIIADCKAAVKQVEQCIAAHTNDKTSKSVKWALFGRDSMLKYTSILRAYQRALNMAIETLNISVSKDIKVDTANILIDTSEIKEDTSQILQQIAKLQARLPDEVQDGTRFILQRYFDSLTDYAESSLGRDTTHDHDDESPRHTPLEERLALVDEDIPLNLATSITIARIHNPSASISELEPSGQATTQRMSHHEATSPLALKNDTEISIAPAFVSSDVSWCKGRASPISIPHPQHGSEGHTDMVYALCQAENFIISGSRDKSIRVWKAETRRLAYSPLLGHESSVFGMVADHETDILVSGGGNGSLIVWKISTGELQENVKQAHGDSILSIKLNTRYVVSTSKDRTAKVWARSALQRPGERQDSQLFPHSVLRGHTGAVNSVVLTESEAITGCGDRTIRVFDIESGTCIKQISSHEKTIASLALSPDGQYIISAGGDEDIFIHHKQSGCLVSRWKSHDELTRTLMVIQAENLIVTGSYDESVAIWAYSDQGTWRKERSLDVKETQRVLGLDLKQQQRNLDFTSNVRNAIVTGTEAAALSSGVVLCMLSTGKQILCGAGCTIVGWEFGDQVEEELERQRSRTGSSESRRKKGKRQQLLQHIKDRF